MRSQIVHILLCLSNSVCAGVAVEKLRVFVGQLVEQYVAVVGVRVAGEPDSAHYGPLTTALDKFHRRLHAITQLLPNTNFGE